MISPISRSVVRHSSAHREKFRSNDPLPRFNVISNFLRRSIIKQLVSGCQNATYKTFCSYSQKNEDDFLNGFCEPNEKDVFLTVHERPTRPIPALNRLATLFETRTAIDEVSNLTGIPLTMISSYVVTSWQPGAFVQPHTDYNGGNDASLIIAISLTTGWRTSYGGNAVYSWTGLKRAVRVTPQCNAAVLFVPFRGSTHWVEQLSSNAPARRRFTWTAFFV